LTKSNETQVNLISPINTNLVVQLW